MYSCLSNSVLQHRKIRYKLNNDEREQIAKAEREKRRKIRLLQVREISRKNAASIRNAVRLEKLKQLQKLADNISDEFDKSKQQQLKELEENYENSLRNIGRAHINASKQMEAEDTKEKSKKENKSKAACRHNAALERLHDDKVRKYIHDNKHIIARKAALDKEKERAAQIASLPKPSPGIIQDVLQKVYPVSVRNENVNQDEIYYPATTMVKRHHNESVEDGRKAAMIQEELLDEQFHRAKSLAVEREQVAKIRFKKAIDKELLNRDSEKVIKELSFLQKKQMKQRQKQLASIPKQVFLPPYKRAEALQDKQRIMEEEFEQFYVGGQMALKNDLSVLLEPHPPVETPSQTDSLDLTLTSDIEASPAKNLPNQSSIMKDITNVSLPPAQTTTTKRQTLQSLFDRIKSQRDDWISDMAENLQDAEVANGRNKTNEPGEPSDMPTPTESADKYESEISDSLTEVVSALETNERPQESLFDETSSATIPVANVVQKMEEIQKHLQQISLTEEDMELEVLAEPEEAEDMASGEPAKIQPAGIASHLQKQISEVLEQKKRIQDQKRQLEERLRQFDQHQNKASLGGYIFNPPGFSRPSHVLSPDLVHSPADDNSVKDSKDGIEDVPDPKILNSGSNLASSNSDIETDPHNQQSPNYLANEALKRLPKDITKIQQYQQRIIQQHTERIKRIEEIQMDIQQNRNNLKNSISGISLVEAIPKSDPAPSRIISTDPSTLDPFESTTKQTDGISNMYDVPVSSPSNALLTGFHPKVSLPYLSGSEHKILPNWNQSKDQILDSDLLRLDGLFQKGTDSLPTYQSYVEESIVGNLFRSEFPGSVSSLDFQENITGKKKCSVFPLESNVQHFQPENLSVETRPSELNSPDLGITPKIYSPYAFTPSLDLDSLPTEPIPSSELQEIRKSLPFDETLEDSAQPTPIPSQTVSPHKVSYNDSAISETKAPDVPDDAVPLPSNTAENQGGFLQIQKQLEEVRKQKEKLCQRMMDNQFEQQAKVLESLTQETLVSSLDMSDHMPLFTELSKPPKKHPPLIPIAYRYGHSPHELSAIQEKDSSVLSSHLSDMHSKLSMSSSFCSSSEPTQTNLDPLISGQLLEEKKLWNILKILKHENLDSSSDISQNGSKAASSSFATSSPFLSEVKYFGTNVQPPPAITVSTGNLSAQPQKSNINEILQPPTSSKTWAQILLEKSQLSEESDPEINTSILQKVPESTYNSQMSLPISADTDCMVLRNYCSDATGTQLIGLKAVPQDDRKTVLALSSSLGSLHCEPKSSETSSDESRLVPRSHTRDSSSPAMQTQDSSDGSSLANSEFLSMSSLTKDLLQNHEELSEFLSSIAQTSRRFRSETLQPSTQSLPLDSSVQILQNSTGSSPSPHSSNAVSVSPSCYTQRDSALALYPSTVSDTIMSAGGGELASSALLQLTNTANQSVMGNGPTLCVWSPSTVDNTANQSGIGDGSTLCAWSPSTANNIANTTSASLVDADSKTNSSDDSLISVIPQTSTVDVGKALKQSSPSQITVSSPLPSWPISETRFSPVCHPPRESSSCYKAATVSVSREQIRDEIVHTASSNQAFTLPSSTPNSSLKSPSHPPSQLSGPSELSRSIYVSPISHDIANPSYSILAGVVSSNLQTTPTPSPTLTQYSIHTTSESDDNEDQSPSSNSQDHLTQQIREYSGVEVGKFLSSYSPGSVSGGTTPSFAMKAMTGVELSKVAESLLPSVATVIATQSSSSSSPSSVGSYPSTQLQYQPTDQGQIKTKESSSSPGTQSPPSSSCQMQCTIETQKFLSHKVSSKMSSSIPSASPPNDKDVSKLDQSKVLEPLPQTKSTPILSVIYDQSHSNKSSPVSSSENLYLTQYSYTSPETCIDETQSPSGQIDCSTSLDPSNHSSHQLSQKSADDDVQEEKPSNPVVKAINPWQHSEPPGTNNDIWVSLTQDVSNVSVNPSSSESESFKYTKSSSGSSSSHSGKQGSPDVELQTKESSTDDSSRDESPAFVPLMCNRNTSSESSDATPEKVLPVPKSFQTTLEVDGTVDASVAEATSIIAGASSPPELTDSHGSGKIVSSADLSSLSGLSQLSLPSDMMEDYQHLIQQARTLVKRCKANLQQVTKDKAYASGDSGLQSCMALTSAQGFFSEAHTLAKEGSSLSSGDRKHEQATNREATEMTEPNLILEQQFPDLNQLGILDEPNLSLVSSGNDSTTVEVEGPWIDTGMANTNSARTGYLTENKEVEIVNPKRLDTSNQSRMRPDQTVSNSVAAWKLKYSLGTRTKK